MTSDLSNLLDLFYDIVQSDSCFQHPLSHSENEIIMLGCTGVQPLCSRCLPGKIIVHTLQELWFNLLATCKATPGFQFRFLCSELFSSPCQMGMKIEQKQKCYEEKVRRNLCKGQSICNIILQDTVYIFHAVVCG